MNEISEQRIFPASPASRLFRSIGIASILLVVGVLLFLAWHIWEGARAPVAVVILLPLILLLAWLHLPRAFVLTPFFLKICRPIFGLQIPLEEIKSVRFEPEAIKHSWRICGNGGFFGAQGWYHNKALGFYRAYVTDPARTVVVATAKRNYVLSPEEPERFVEELRRLIAP